MSPDMTIPKNGHCMMQCPFFLISFGRAFRCSQVLFVRRSSSFARPLRGRQSVSQIFTKPSQPRLPIYRQISLQHTVLLRSCSLRVLPAPLRSGFLSVARLSRPCQRRLPRLRRLTSLRRLPWLRSALPGPSDFSAPPLCSACPSPAPGPPGQLMLRRSGSFSGEAASMSICSLTI